MERLKKLKVKEQEELILLSLPQGLEGLKDELRINHAVKETLPSGEAGFILAFFESQEEIRRLVPRIMESVSGDTLLWTAYPKKSSKKYRSDISRDQGWEILGQYGYEPVSQIALDEDWSALRFRPVDKIKDFRRNEKMVLSDEGRSRTRKNENT